MLVVGEMCERGGPQYHLKVFFSWGSPSYLSALQQPGAAQVTAAVREHDHQGVRPMGQYLTDGVCCRGCVCSVAGAWWSFAERQPERCILCHVPVILHRLGSLASATCVALRCRRRVGRGGTCVHAGCSEMWRSVGVQIVLECQVFDSVLGYLCMLQVHGVGLSSWNLYILRELFSAGMHQYGHVCSRVCACMEGVLCTRS